MLFTALEALNTRPAPFAFYTAAELWDDEHTSARMLSFHLDEALDRSSRKAPFIQASVDWIIARFALSGDSNLADFGCGPGLYAERLARHGVQVTGIDFSRRSLQYARRVAEEQGLPIRYVHQNYLDFEGPERFDLILMIMCDFCALSPGQRRVMLQKFRSQLKPGGKILLDVYSLAAFERRQEGRSYELDPMGGFWSPNPCYGFQNTFKYEPEAVVLDQYTLVEADRVRTVYNWFQHFSPDSLRAELEVCGLGMTELLGDVAGKPYDAQSDEFAVVAEGRS